MSKSPDQIGAKMQQVRRNLDDDVERIVESAREMADWHWYPRRYPWATLGLAAAVGYLVVPNRLEIMSPDTDTLLRLVKENKLVVKADPQPQQRGGLVGVLFTLAATAATRGLTSFVGGQLGRFTSSQFQGDSHRPAASTGR